ncbi:hypothetical protein HYFRA_00005044 [Hymenoscyphus fraxineus]|uniref:Uncharacterized protein n=1 Tax=Hymenoscyphus fraxineus TaxID=746836 RepID=A0A9N9PMY1_9HELO|nr:hypothetical protein HYFRA_00005044 [Hymenoscyphus fraxineus]
MSAFSRGYLLQNRLFARPVQVESLQLKGCQPRFFTSSQFLCAKVDPPSAPRRGAKPLKSTVPKKEPGGLPAKDAAILKPSKLPTPQNPPNAAPTKGLAIPTKTLELSRRNPILYAESLAQKSHPSIIYTAPSHTRLFFLCSAGAAGIMAQAAYCIHIYLLPPDGLAWFVPYSFGIGGMIGAGLGTWMMLSTSGIIRQITAIPKKAMSTSPVAKRAQKLNLELEVEFRKMLPIPFFPARKIYISPSEFGLHHPVAPQMQAERFVYEESQKYGAVSRALQGLWNDSKRAWTRDGFEKVRINSRTYKLDVTGDQSPDVGHAIDKLANIYGKR